jgi:hypothetical protein
VRRTGLVVALFGATAARLTAQQSPVAYPEFRADALFGKGTTGQAGLGVVVPLGVYVRLGLDGAAGATWQNGVSSATGRVDAIVRFLLDPLRESGAAISLGGGLSAPIRKDGVKSPYLTVVIDVEGKARRGITPALELGLGGGGRVGIVLRRSPPRWR